MAESTRRVGMEPVRVASIGLGWWGDPEVEALLFEHGPLGYLGSSFVIDGGMSGGFRPAAIPNGVR